jgi:hypothetical protein
MPAAAQDGSVDDNGAGVSVAVTAGTLGIGPEVGVRMSDHVGARVNATFLGFGADFDSDEITYDGKLKLKSYGAMVDLYPMGGHFRVSAGARINKNRARVVATPTGPVEVGGTTYTPAQIGTLRGRAEVKEFAPALTLGWSGANRRGFMFGGDVGVLFQGRVRIRDFTATGALSNAANFRASLEEERRELQDDVDDYKVYPIAQISIGYRF